MKQIIIIFIGAFLLAAGVSRASIFLLPANGDNVVGALQFQVVSGTETLLDIARRYNIGYNEIVAANPEINPWVPDSRKRVIIPSQFILPPKPWEGVVINLPEMRLYYFPPITQFSDQRVITVPLSIGKINWSTPTGNFYVKEKIKHPSWTVPESIVTEHGLERYGNRRIIPPLDEENPLGAYAILLNETGYLIHGTNKPFSIGRRVSHGCLRLYPEDIEQLFDYVERNMPVRIINQPYKVGIRQNTIYVETHKVLDEDVNRRGMNMTPIVQEVIRQTSGIKVPTDAWRHLDRIISDASGLPTPLLKLPRSQVVNHTQTEKFSRN
ncbi:L,D-transpeptidase family protein [Kaarinaea lacus]